jgi:uncharacterized protein YegL
MPTTKTKAKKSTKKTTLPTEVVFVLDESGSMTEARAQTIDGLNEYVNGLKESDPAAAFTLIMFDDPATIDATTAKVRVKLAGVKAEDVRTFGESDYKPRGLTPLLDAVGVAIRTTEDRLQEQKANVLCVILTDGLENASREYTRAQIRELIEQKTNDGWSFLYLGANQDAFTVGKDMGIAEGNTMVFDSTQTGMSKTMRGVAQVTQTYVASASAGTATSRTWFDNSGQTEADYRDDEEDESP